MNWFRRSAVVVMTLVTGLGLAACGSTPTVSPTTTSTRSATGVDYLCQVIPRIDRLIVTRNALTNNFHFTFPRVVTVTNASAAQAVATYACALPHAPRVPRHVLSNLPFPTISSLQCAAKGMGGEYVDMNPTGCEVVTGLGMAREAISRPDFFRLGMQWG